MAFNTRRGRSRSGGARANAKAALGSRASGPARVYRRRRHRVSPSRGLTLSAAALCDGSPGRETLFQSPGTRPTRSCCVACASMAKFFSPISRRTLVSSAGHRTQGDPAGGKYRWVNFHEPPIKNIDEKSPRPTFGFKLDRDFDETRDLRFVCQPRKTRRDWLIGSLGYRLFP